MSCHYILYGKSGKILQTFENELALDDFIRNNYKYLGKLGDLVFSMTQGLAETVTKLDNIDKKARHILETQRPERIYSEDGKSYDYHYPYVGVNKYLNNVRITNESGEEKRLFPEFTEDYWIGHKNDLGNSIGGRYSAWANNQYTDDEKELFFGKNDDGSFKTTYAATDKLTKFKFRRLMENKWENLCLAGTAIHSIYEAYFKRDNNGVYRKDKLFKNGNLDQTEYNLLLEELSKLKFSRNKIKKFDGEIDVPSYLEKSFSDLVTSDIFKQTIEKCKQLEDQLISKYGKTALFIPEFHMTGTPSNSAALADTLIGIIDLLVIDKDSQLHIIDYKTSIHPFDSNEDERGFYASKKLAYMYLLATYGRMLALNGFTITKADYKVLPIQLGSFLQEKDSDGDPISDKFTFIGINYKGNNEDMFDNITNRINQKYVLDNLNSICDYDITYDVSSEDILTLVGSGMISWFPKYALYQRHEELQIADMLKEAGCFNKRNEETGNFEWKANETDSDPTVVAENEKDLVEKVKKYLDRQSEFRNIRTLNVIKALKECTGKNCKSIHEVEFPTMASHGDRGINSQWFILEMQRYNNPNWEVVENDTAEALQKLGIIMIYNNETRLYNFIKITTQPPKIKRYLMEGRMSLAGNFLPDIHYLQKQNNLMLLSVQGNIELIETMLAINAISKLNGVVGEISVIDPHKGLGLSASNRELMYTFAELSKLSPLEHDNFKTGKIKLGSKLHIAQTTLKDIMTMGLENEWKGDYNRFKNFTSCMSALDDAVVLPKEKLIQALEKLIAELSIKGKLKELDPDLQEIQKDLGKLKQKHIQLYNLALLALAELKNINFRLQLKDHDLWLENIYIFKKGITGTYLDNPGNLSSETLNLLTKLVTEAYQNVRSDMQKPISETRKLVENLKKEKNFGWVTENTTGNQADLYKNMYREDIKDDILFKDPWSDSSLKDAEREFLKYALKRINENRFKERADEMRFADPKSYFRVPLCKGDSSSFASKKGLLEAFKDRLKGWTKEGALARAKATAEGIFDKIDLASEKERRNTEMLFEMNNIFSKGESEERNLIIEKWGKELFESNLETLLLKHDFAYSSQKRIDSVMPMIKAAMVHLTTSGAFQNTDFKLDLKYAEEYIRNKIKNESIIDPKFEEANAILGKVKGAASKMVLALSPIQAIGQTLQGIWNDISLILRKPDGSLAFTWNNMWKAAKIVYLDLFNVTDKPTLSSLINELYGINDMDMNTYTDRIKSDQHGIHNFTNFLYKFASRPDFYNRMTIFLARMLSDGCLEAHSIVDGELKYDCYKDKRYSAYLNDPTGNSLEVQKARALYYEAAKLFIAEGVIALEDLDLKNPKPLPRAYTNLEAESMKSLSDTIYGYYSHEKKSMIQSTLIGGLWMQFKTYWSGKKNLYLSNGGVKLEGNWILAEEEINGEKKKLYYKLDENGIPTEEMTDTPNEFPVYRWEGNWKEGILVSMWDFMGRSTKVGPLAAWREKINHPDPKLRAAYRNNFKLFGIDMFFWVVLGSACASALGDWLKEEKKNADKDNVLDGIRLAMCNIAVKSLSYSTLDFNWADSIGSPATSWTPFAFEYFSRLFGNISKVALGEEDAWDAAVRSSAAANSIKPFMDTIKPNWAYNNQE